MTIYLSSYFKVFSFFRLQKLPESQPPIPLKDCSLGHWPDFSDKQLPIPWISWGGGCKHRASTAAIIHTTPFEAPSTTSTGRTLRIDIHFVAVNWNPRRRLGRKGSSVAFTRVCPWTGSKVLSPSVSVSPRSTFVKTLWRNCPSSDQLTKRKHVKTSCYIVNVQPLSRLEKRLIFVKM